MGKRRRNEQTILAAAQGFSKVRICTKHELLTQPVRIFGRKSMEHHCKEGCKLDKSQTKLIVPEATRGRR
jgi:hypothetical protein